MTLDAALIVTGSEENFQEVLATSTSVPVIAVIWSPRSLESKPVVALFEELARDYAGRFQLVSIDGDANPQIVHAFQVQGVPAVVALISGRPLPLFQGNASKEQIRPIIDQVLEAAAQMGVTGRISVTEEQTSAPIPPEHQAALAAEEAGDLDSAIEAWERIISRNPRDTDAQNHLSRVRLAARAASADTSDPAARADQLFEAGDHAGAFEILLNLIATAPTPEERDAARERLLDLFRVAGHSTEVNKARMRLATLVLI